ncbi:Aspartyl-tRNA synthetase @ Aspartyl-tRNA(Asn) synthetase [hydrothermal vent metagenome]|uniref:Aspartyl-tRNA synthetase @ Aspartyl-tRNA(Asn) synthetase n=1 Tax=hydrothermal vent metagenome TaxID=652676 RepID=A0A3B0SF48_9ZZZZ
MHAYRTHTCGELRNSDVDSSVRLSGWIHRKRDHGGLLFIDLRDHYGLTQCVILPENEHFETLERMRIEGVISVTGKVVARTDETINKNLPTGGVELHVEQLEVQSTANELPLPVFGEPDYPDDIRLKYRYLDLRRETLHKNIVLRSQVISSIRRRMTDQGFMEFQTPILTASSPEGARDFLVPSRLHPGEFYALPQAPQQFKQLIMVSGFDKYFQIAPCFRDEDSRADRSPGEFYQLDVEMSFCTQEDVFGAVEPMLRDVFVEFANGRKVPTEPFVRIPYKEAMLKYGTDKPDLRIPFEISDVSEFFTEDAVEFGAFKNIVKKGGVVRAIPAPNVADKPRSFFDKMNGWAQKEMQAPGLGYINFAEEDGVLVGKGPIAKFFPADTLQRMAAHAKIGAGDALFFSAGKTADAAKLAGAARAKIGADLGLISDDEFRFCWIVDFPMFEWNEDEKRIDFSHNPFSMPQGGMDALDNIEPLDILAYQYDIVCNGVELSSGAIRNHRPEIMLKAFEMAGYGPDVVEDKFGGMLNAFRFGAPPHGGIAPGIDRIVMLLAGVENIREVILFPMNQQARDLMMQAPNTVSGEQLRELHIRKVEPPKKDG